MGKIVVICVAWFVCALIFALVMHREVNKSIRRIEMFAKCGRGKDGLDHGNWNHTSG